MSIGVGGGSGSSQTSSPAANKLAELSEQFATETEGIRTGLIGTMQKVLTGGSGKGGEDSISSIPIIASAIEGSRKAGSRAMRETDERLAQSGLAGTPHGENIRAGQMQEGEQTVAKTKDAMAQNIFGMISNFVLGQSQTAASGLAGAIPGMSSTSESAKSMSAGGGMPGK